MQRTTVSVPAMRRANQLIGATDMGLAIVEAHDRYLDARSDNKLYVSSPDARFVDAIRGDTPQRITLIGALDDQGNIPAVAHVRTSHRHNPLVIMLVLLTPELQAGLTDGGHVFDREPRKGDRIVVPAGTPVESTAWSGARPSKRTQTVYVHMSSRYERTISWAGSGGYWRDVPYDLCRPGTAGHRR